MSQEFKHVPFSEIIERIKDKISYKIDGSVRDYHVAEAIGLDYSAVRVYKQRNYIPLPNVIIFCQTHNISVDWMIFDKNVTVS